MTDFINDYFAVLFAVMMGSIAVFGVTLVLSLTLPKKLALRLDGFFAFCAGGGLIVAVVTFLMAIFSRISIWIFGL